MARVHLLFSALCALPLCCGSEGISWDVHGVVHSVPATTRKYLGRRSVRVNATSARIVELSGSLEWICAQGESGMPPEITGAIVTIASTSVLNLPCDDALSYLAFRGAGARAVLAGAATRYPGGDYYLHNGIFTARRAPMPWLDVNDDALRDVVAAVRDGHAVLLEPSASNPWRKLFRSWCWVVIFRVTVPVCALATTYLAVKTLRARGFGELLPVLVLVVEALSMLSIALASSIFGLYWSGDVAGRLVTELHISMYISGGFNCYPAEIERGMAAHPAIAQVAVIGVPDARLGEVGKAYVVPRPGQKIEAESLIRWCREHMANYKVPRQIECLPVLPTNASGKVMKYQLRAAVADALQ